MPKSKQQKEEILRDLKNKISKAKSVIFTSYDSLSAEENNLLRKNLKAENSEYYVAKKTFFELAFKDKKIESLKPRGFKGKVAAVFGYGDEVSPAKVVDEFKKTHENTIEFVGGILEDKYIDSEAVSKLAKIPSREELYAKLVGSLNAPISGFVNALAGNLRNLVYVLNAIKNKKEA